MNKPLYQSAYDSLLKLIAEGEFPPGSALPNEFEIGSRLNVSQGTARKALIMLEQKGVVQRRQGKGTFVTLRTPEDSLFNFYPLRDAENQQIIPQLESETVSRRKATRVERETLYGNPAEVFSVARYRTHLGQPLTIEESVLPTDLFPGLMERVPLPNAMYVLFQHAYGCVIISAEEKLWAEILGPERAAPHNLDPQKPVVIGRRESIDLLDRTVEIRTNIYFSDTARYSATLK